MMLQPVFHSMQDLRLWESLQQLGTRSMT
ncbi:unnamed protein product [Lathyrus sativus]|nr:unnamed protein product [Lathyrus sativus]